MKARHSKFSFRAPPSSLSLRLNFIVLPSLPVRPPATTSSTPSKASSLPVLASLSAAFFIAFVFLCILRRRKHRNHQRSTTPPPSSGAEPSVVRSLPLRTYEAKEKVAVDCTVCLCEFEEKETVKEIPNCGHIFHPECIEMWLFSHSSCPLCRSTQLLLPSVQGL